MAALLVPMNLPGLTVRPIPNLMDHGFCELFFDDFRVPISSRLGPENQGWKVAMDALMFERIGMARFARALKLLDELIGRLQKSGELSRPAVAEKSVGRSRPVMQPALSPTVSLMLAPAPCRLARRAISRAWRRTGPRSTQWT
ncbi:MAG: hypothetical protein IPJ97_16230 [Proteobacteria bacterium]|nr:hypothetical protein [Pseudomonadota bacterium]